MSQRNYLKQLPFNKVTNLKRFTNFLTNSQPELKQWLVNNDLTIIDAYLEVIPKNVQSNIFLSMLDKILSMLSKAFV